jgi:Camelysin metallo-endopeptidase
VRRLVVIAAGLALAGIVAGGAAAYFTAHGTASATFHVADAGTLKLTVDPISGSLEPGGSLEVHFTVTNPTSWPQRVGTVGLDDPGFDGLPDGCPASAFGFAPVQLDAQLDPGASVEGHGTLTMDGGAPFACSGADPTIHLAAS